MDNVENILPRSPNSTPEREPTSRSTTSASKTRHRMNVAHINTTEADQKKYEPNRAISTASTSRASRSPPGNTSQSSYKPGPSKSRSSTEIKDWKRLKHSSGSSSSQASHQRDGKSPHHPPSLTPNRVQTSSTSLSSRALKASFSENEDVMMRPSTSFSISVSAPDCALLGDRNNRPPQSGSSGLQVSKRRKAQPENQEREDTPQHLVAQIVARITDPNNSSALLKDELDKSEKLAGIIEIHLVGTCFEQQNDNSKLLLIEAKNLFCQQLPNIPEEYITRHVFDPHHKNLVMTNDKKVIGGTCFRSFASQGFSEIVFLAVKSTEQLKGYGSLIMSHLKDYHVRKNVLNLLTYADLKAIGYFKKQAFKKRISLDEKVYKGYIKEYDKAILVHCELNPRIVYTELPSVIRLQKKIVDMLIDMKKKAAERIHPGLTCFREGVRSIPIESIPGLREAGWRPSEQASSSSSLPHDVLRKMIKSVLELVKKHKMAWPFLEPVDTQAVPDYLDHIKFPMDLKTMTEKFEQGYYSSCKLFNADMTRIFTNCRLYNRPETVYCICANSLEKFFRSQMAAQGLCNDVKRRSTKTNVD